MTNKKDVNIIISRLQKMDIFDFIFFMFGMITATIFIMIGGNL